MKHKKIFQFHSIRHRIMLIFMGLMAAMLLAIWGVNSWWLEKYYVDQKMKVMEQAYTDIDSAIQEKVGENENIGDVLREELEQEWDIWKQTAKGDTDTDYAEKSSGADETESASQADEVVPADIPADFPEAQGTLLGTIRSYSEQNNIAITLIDSDTGKALVSSGRDSDFLTQKLQRYVLGMGHKHMEILKQHDNYVVEKNRDFRSSSTYMESWGYFSDNRTMFIMSMPLASIQESVALSNRFTTWVGLIVLVFGSIMMCFVTNRITKPIMKLSSLSEEMSRLNFDVSYEDDAEDEVKFMLPVETMQEKLQSALSVKRYIHTMGVAEEAVKLAEIYGTPQDQQKARVAGLLHDCAKDYPEAMRLRFCKEYKVKMDEIMEKQTDLIHPFLGAEVARREYQVTDEDILNAIRYHTTGRAGMSLLEKIIFIADYIEPNREKFDGLEEARRLAYLDLDMAMKYILESTIAFVKERGRLLHPLSLEALEYYKHCVEKEETE